MLFVVFTDADMWRTIKYSLILEAFSEGNEMNSLERNYSMLALEIIIVRYTLFIII